jgi:hypothetical protein
VTKTRRSLVQIERPQPLAGEQVAGLLVRDPDLNPCFSHDHRPDAKDTQTTALPESHHAIAAREGALPTVPERRRTAGSGPAAALPILVGVSLSQHCPGQRPTLGAMALQRAVYGPRDAEHTVLHQVIAEHLEVFLRAGAKAGNGAGLPQFVERESREFLTCGVFEHGVARWPRRRTGRGNKPSHAPGPGRLSRTERSASTC